MITKILELLNNPMLSKSFCQSIKETLDEVLTDFSNDLSVQKDLLDQILITINNQIELELNNIKIEDALLQLVETERVLENSLIEMRARSTELADKKLELELLSLGVVFPKEVVEA